MNIEYPQIARADAISSPGRHSRKGKLSCELRGAADKQVYGTGVPSMDVDLAFQQDAEMVGRIVLPEDDSLALPDSLRWV